MKKFLKILVVLVCLFIIYDVWQGKYLNQIWGMLFVKTDPCALLTQAEIEEAMGQSVQKVKSGAFGKSKYCTFETQDEPKRALVVSAIEPDDDYYSGMKVLADQEVDGIGDAAFATMIPPKVYVQVRKKNVCLTFEMHQEEPRDVEGKERMRWRAVREEKTLAPKAVARLER